MKRKNQLSQFTLFEGISSASIDKLLQAGTFLDVPKGTLLIRAKEPVASIFFQLSGKSIIYNLTHSGKRKIWRLSHQLKNTMSSIYLERKLAAKLWKLSRDFGIPTESGIEIDVNMTITFLADMLGVPRETTSRVCSVLVEHGLIAINKKRITISDPQKMAQFYKTGQIE